jgi:hypothetical protein
LYGDPADAPATLKPTSTSSSEIASCDDEAFFVAVSTLSIEKPVTTLPPVRPMNADDVLRHAFAGVAFTH